MGSHSDEHVQLAEPLGRWLAQTGYHLLTGGGPGVMTAVSRAFTQVTDRRGLTLGVIPAATPNQDPDQNQAPFNKSAPRKGYPAPWVEIPIYTHLFKLGTQGDHPLSRNHINILSSDVVVALPGSEGTASEVRLAKEYGRPVVAYLAEGDPVADPPPGWPTDVMIAKDLKQVQEFIGRYAPIDSKPD